MRLWPFGKTENRASLENPMVPLSDVGAWHQLLGEWHNVAGVDVTPFSALQSTLVWSAVNFISGSFASLPLEVFKITGDDEAEVDKNDQLYPILHDSPNPETTSFSWREGAMNNVLVHAGRSYTFIEKNKAGRPMNLWPLDPNKTVVKRQNGSKIYEYKDGDRTLVYKAAEIIDIPFMLEADGFTHVSPVSRLAGAIGLTLALEKYGQKFFANGGVPPLALNGPVGSPAAASRAATDVANAVRAANEERRNVIIMPSGYTLAPVGFDPQKSQMTEARQFQIGEVARMYGLPPVFLQDLTHGTYSNTEQQDLAYVKHTLTTWLTQWEQELNLKLFGPRSKKFVRFDVDSILRGDFKTRMEGNARAIQTAQVTPNEARKTEGRKPLPEGDKLYIQGATVPLGTQPVGPGQSTDGDEPAGTENTKAPA